MQKSWMVLILVFSACAALSLAEEGVTTVVKGEEHAIVIGPKENPIIVASEHTIDARSDIMCRQLPCAVERSGQELAFFASGVLDRFLIKPKNPQAMVPWEEVSFFLPSPSPVTLDWGDSKVLFRSPDDLKSIGLELPGRPSLMVSAPSGSVALGPGISASVSGLLTQGEVRFSDGESIEVVASFRRGDDYNYLKQKLNTKPEQFYLKFNVKW